MISWAGLSWRRADFLKSLQERPSPWKVCTKQVLITGDGLAQVRGRCFLFEAVLHGGKHQLGGNGAVVDPGQVGAAAPDGLVEALQVGGQESKQVLTAIGDQVEPLSRPAPESGPALGMDDDVNAVKRRRHVRLDGD